MLSRDTEKPKIIWITTILVILVFVLWSLNIRNVFEEGYYEGIKKCLMSQEGFVIMTNQGKDLYSGQKGLRTNITLEEMMTFLESLNSTQS